MRPGFEHHLWSRLLVIAYEDVSALAPGNIPASISQMREDYFWFGKRKNPAAMLVLSNAILLLCRARESKIADNFLIVMGKRIDNGLSLEIPDYAIDKHTRRGRKLGRGEKHFLEEGWKINPEAEIEDIYKEEAAKHLSEEIKCFEWVKESN